MAFTFRLMTGTHYQGSGINTRTGKKTESKRYRATRGDITGEDIVVSDTRLDKQFGPQKFQMIEAISVGQPKPNPKPVVIDETVDAISDEFPEETEDDGLADLTVKELRSFAEEEGIDLGHAGKKTDIIEAIRDELVTQEA